MPLWRNMLLLLSNRAKAMDCAASKTCQYRIWCTSRIVSWFCRRPTWSWRWWCHQIRWATSPTSIRRTMTQSWNAECTKQTPWLWCPCSMDCASVCTVCCAPILLRIWLTSEYLLLGFSLYYFTNEHRFFLCPATWVTWKNCHPRKDGIF